MDSECSIVSADHRDELLPILIRWAHNACSVHHGSFVDFLYTFVCSFLPCMYMYRVLYGRMQKQGGSKSGGNSKRGIVLRFLGGCEGSKMAEFINLIILPFKSLLTSKHNVPIQCHVLFIYTMYMHTYIVKIPLLVSTFQPVHVLILCTTLSIFSN